MDETIAKWILEFLLRQKIDDKLINGIISSLPVLSNDYRLKKTMLLRRIETETNNGTISEIILDLIELIEALDHEFGELPSDLMKEAYCLVAVDCTVRFLGENVEENVKFREMIEIVWKNRVCKSEGLFSEVTRRWFDDIVAAVKDSSVCEKLWMRNTRNEALKAVKACLKEAWDGLGPSFLELAVKKAGNHVEEVSRGGGGGGDSDGVVSIGTQKGPPLTRRKHVAVKGRRQRGAKLSDTDEVAINQAGDDITETVRVEDPIPEVTRGKEAISSSPTKLPAVGDHPSDTVGKTHRTISSPKPTGKKSVVAGEEVGPKILESSEAVRGKGAISSSPTKLPAVGDHLSGTVGKTHRTISSPKPTGKKSVVADEQVGPKILESSDAVRVQRELRSSIRALHASVTDPLPEALKRAQAVTSSIETNNIEPVARIQVGSGAPTVPEAQEVAKKTVSNAEENAGPSKQAGTKTGRPKGSNENDRENGTQHDVNEDARSSIPVAEKAREMAKKRVTNTGKDAGASKQAAEVDASKQSNENDPAKVNQDTLNEDGRGPGTRTRKRSLMEPNDTRHTYEWDDEIENSSGSPARPRLPSPKVQKTSPLKVNFRRRERKRWTPVEEDTLREGVSKYGRGSWKAILNDAKFSEVFQCRTEVDLKDKWRNLTKYS